MMRNFSEMFLRARRALEFSHGQDPERNSDHANKCVSKVIQPPRRRDITTDKCGDHGTAMSNPGTATDFYPAQGSSV
jgi:hypothetical protein